MSLFHKEKNWTRPSGEVYELFVDALSKPHLLVAGATGSGKSVLLNGLIATALHRKPDSDSKTSYSGRISLILIDPKRVELSAYRNLPHTIEHVAGYDPAAWQNALQTAVNIMDERYTIMERNRSKEWQGGDLYVIIDEWATVYKSGGKACYNPVLRLTSEGRAAKIHVILSSQVSKASIIPIEIRENLTAKFALMCNTAAESRAIIGVNGCECLPDPKTEGEALGVYCLPGKNNYTLYRIPYVQEDEIDRLIIHWLGQTSRSALANAMREIESKRKSRSQTSPTPPEPRKEEPARVPEPTPAPDDSAPVAEDELISVDFMDGHDFEYWCADLLRKNGFTNVSVTQGSGDQGVDVLAQKDDIKYAVQCKCYSSDLGNTPIQEVHAGKMFYGCQVGAVMTNRYFTKGARELAEKTGVLLWDRDRLAEMLNAAP